MDDVLALCSARPARTCAAGDVLLDAHHHPDEMYVIVDGLLEVRRGDLPITRLNRPGAIVGEMSALLGRTTEASVIAVADTTVHVISRPLEAMADDPALALAVGRVLARRLEAMTTYLADLREQYADTGGHLALMDQVLAELMSAVPVSEQPGSERGDQPPM